MNHACSRRLTNGPRVLVAYGCVIAHATARSADIGAPEPRVAGSRARDSRPLVESGYRHALSWWAIGMLRKR